ncbi:MAG: 30S ribosomal protein S17 [Syntrophobacterales bacterium]|jgi:small subunit ribosomal protein S17|nr:30S ribosomal protein S17 [Syntrophobacterales bacterium]
MSERGNNRTIQGVVISDKMDKTVVVMSERLVRHPVVHKFVKRRVKYKVHDEANSCQVGDKVLIIESRPLSKEKRWRVREIIQKAK